MIKKYKILNKNIIHDGFFKLYELNFTHEKHDGTWSPELKREIFGGAHVTTVLPYDPVKKKILLIKQCRAGIINRQKDPILLEIVAGIIDEGETPAQAAKRECFEETGCKVNKLDNINSYFPAPGSSESFYHLFFAEIEYILVRSYDIDEVKNLMKKKQIKSGVTLIALQWFFLEYLKN